MWETFVNFIITWISLALISKILGKGLVATKSGLFLTALANASFGALFRYGAYLFITMGPFKVPPLLIAMTAMSITLLIIPAFTFWFADKFIKGFKIKSRKYFPTACAWFVLIGFIGVGIYGFLPFLGIGLFGLGSRWVGAYAHPGWFYGPHDSFYFYGTDPYSGYFYE